MPITINNIVLDPETPLPFAVSDALIPSSAVRTDYILVGARSRSGVKKKTTTQTNEL